MSLTDAETTPGAEIPPAVEAADLASAAGRTRPHWTVRYGVWIVGSSLLLPQIIGSVFNIVYNIHNVETLLTREQLEVFFKTIKIYNSTIYLLAPALWTCIIVALNRPFRKLLHGDPIAPNSLAWGRRMAINLPWWGVCLGGVGWFLCVPAFLGALTFAPGRLDPRVYAHLTTSFLISALIATTHAYFLLEMLSQRLLYPVFFRDSQPADTPGAHIFSLRARGLLWVLSTCVCPIGSLLLLIFAPHEDEKLRGFALAVGGIGMAFGVTTAWLVGRWVTEPVSQLKRAARAVAAGDLTAHVGVLRADDFGPLIDEFNQMVGDLRDKQLLQETFGRHVGEQAAKLILDRDPGLGGFEETVTLVFVDIRNFTARCESSAPQDVVVVLNMFLTDMVETVENHGGMVNKFLGDGFMAIFGLTGDRTHHADSAVASGREMLFRLDGLNERLALENQAPLRIGIGIHTGLTIVGSVGSPRRMEFTAIGDAVNVASRVEGLTRRVGQPLLMTSATRDALKSAVDTVELPPQPVKGQSEPLIVCRLSS